MRSPSHSLRVVALLGLGLLTAACGGNTSQSASGPVTLTVWSMGAEGDALQKSALLAAFQKQNPNITIQVTPVSWAVAHDKLITSVAGKQTPDVSQLGTTWMGEFARLNALDQVPSSIDTSIFFQGAMSTTQVNGKTVGLPWYVDTRVLYYRKDLLQKAGIASAPTTWDELNADAKMLKASGVKEALHLSTNNWQEWAPFLWSNGGDIMSNGKFTLDSQKSIESIAEYTSFFNAKESLPQAANFDVTPAFVNGDVAMFFSGPWHVGLITTAGLDQAKWGVTPMPKKTSGTSFVGGADLVVFKNSPHRDAAWKFVQYMTTNSVQVDWYKAVKDLPASKGAWSDTSLSSDQNLKVFNTQMSTTKAPPTISQWEEIGTKLNGWLEKAALGQLTPQAAAQGMQQEATSTYKP